MDFDHILIIGFGGPLKPEEVESFLREVVRGRPVSEARLREVLGHYREVGGVSPYHACVHQMAERLGRRLRDTGCLLPVFIGMKHWHPFLKDTLANIKVRGLKKGLGIILAPHRSEASFNRYAQAVSEARESAGASAIEYEYVDSWHEHTGFIEAYADQVRRVLENREDLGREKTELVFSAHSIPAAMAGRGHYAEAFRLSSQKIAAHFPDFSWSMGYQSRSGQAGELWLEPDILRLLEEAKKQRGIRNVILVPVGFVCDNVEILYDLDKEVRQRAELLGLRYFRAGTVSGHPKFIDMLQTLIEAMLKPASAPAV